MNRMKRDEESCESGPPGFSRRLSGTEKRGDSAKAIDSFRFLKVFANRSGAGRNTGLDATTDVYAFLGEVGNRQEDEQDGGQGIFLDFRIP